MVAHVLVYTLTLLCSAAPAFIPISIPNGSSGTSGGAATLGEGESPVAQSCVKVRTETPFVQGYNHIVVLKSECTKVMECRVTTDVNPKAQTVKIAPEEVQRVMTFRGSPARTFTPQVSCLPAR